MDTIRAELHSHSTYSDGTFEPEVVARMCNDHGVKVWSLTDHDTCAGYERAAAAAQSHGIEFIPGIEVSAYQGSSVHILGYGVDPVAEVLSDFSERRIQARFDRMERMVAKVAELGFPVSHGRVLEIAGAGAIARPHLAQALVEAGHVADIDEAFERLIHNGGPAYIGTTWPTVPIAVEVIRDAGGVAVLAHPGVYGLDAEIPDWVRSGISGIEVGHPKHSAEDESRYAALAADLGLIPTRSSDYHGPQHISAEHFGRVDLERVAFDRLREAIAAA